MNAQAMMKRISTKRLLLGALAFSIATAVSAAQAPAPAPAETQSLAKPRPPAKPGLTLTTTAFEDGGIIPNKYTVAASPAQSVSPDLAWTHVPDGTVSFALILHDPDTSLARTTDEVLHWLIFNIPGTATGLPEAVPNVAQLPDGSIQGLNRAKKPGYLGMGMGSAGPYHHYTWELFALDTKLTLGPDATRAALLAAINGHILDKAVLVGRFHRP
jgi:Raf kinase inhibitor-like YbhB/YbcL family protein